MKRLGGQDPFSYRGDLQMGFTTVPELVPDVQSMADAVEPALAELEKLAPSRN